MKKEPNLEVDFKRMDLMLKSFQRIGPHERAWFIKRLFSDHLKLSKSEVLKDVKP